MIFSILISVEKEFRIAFRNVGINILFCKKLGYVRINVFELKVSYSCTKPNSHLAIFILSDIC